MSNRRPVSTTYARVGLQLHNSNLHCLQFTHGRAKTNMNIEQDQITGGCNFNNIVDSFAREGVSQRNAFHVLFICYFGGLIDPTHALWNPCR